jgi:2-dehydro-3-deoxygluconokinase
MHHVVTIVAMRVTEVTQLIAIGEAMVMVSPVAAESLEHTELVRLTVGGAESNVAAHAARLGLSSAWLGAVGDEPLGRRVVSFMKEHGVSTDWVKTDPTVQTGVYFKDPGQGVLYYRKNSAASHMTVHDLQGVPLERAAVVHISGITPALSSSCEALTAEVFRVMNTADGLLSFDVNHRPALWPDGDAPEKLLDLSQHSDIVFVGLDEAQGLWGVETADEVRGLICEPETLIVKDASLGAYEYRGVSGSGGRTFVPAIPTEVVEPIGAGDAFAAGYLTARLNGADAAARLSAGHQQAHAVLQSTSDFIPDDFLEGA